MGFDPSDFRRGLWHLRKGGVGQLRAFLRKRKAASVGFGRGSWRSRVGGSGWAPWPIPAVGVPRHDIRVGVVADDFSRLAFQYEWDQVDLKPSTWLDALVQGLDLLFVESAWHGVDGSWRYQLTGSKAPSQAMRDLVASCKDAGVPTVFWNKEDPAHFEDFIGTAALFDWVFTTEQAKVEDYRKRLGHDRIAVLPFAAQQSIHNPIRPPGWEVSQLEGVAFAGTFFRHKFPERRHQLRVLIDGAARAVSREKSSLDIYARFSGKDPNYEFPEEDKKFVRGELTYPQMLTAYRQYRVFLNANSVPSSESMCGRRIFEVSACGTPVLTCPTPAVGQAFPDSTIPEASSEESAHEWTRSLLRSQQLRDHMTHLSQREIWKRHTYTHRVDAVLSTVGMTAAVSRRPKVSAMISTNRPHQLDHVLGQMALQVDVDIEILVLCHTFTLSNERKAALESQYGPIRWLEASEDVALGDCYNLLAREATGDVVAKIDDDDWYGPHYLSEQLAALDYSGADVVGKSAHHLYLEDMDATVLRFPQNEHKYRPFVSGPTIVARRQTVLATPFPAVRRGEDTGFLKAVSDAGGVIFSSSRFEFMQRRGGRGRHTWSIDDVSVLANSTLVAYGKALDHVIF